MPKPSVFFAKSRQELDGTDSTEHRFGTFSRFQNSEPLLMKNKKILITIAPGQKTSLPKVWARGRGSIARKNPWGRPSSRPELSR